MYPRTKKLFFDGNDGKTIFWIVFLFSFFFLKRQCVCENIRRIFHYFWNCLNPFLSSRQSKKKTTKTFIFCFCSVPLLFHLKKHFSHFSLSSLLSLFTFSFHFFVHLFLLLSPFSYLSLLHSCFFSLYLSVSLSHTSVPHVSLSLFLQRRFGVSSFCFNSFFFSLFWSWSLCFHTSSLLVFFFISVSVFSSKKSKFSVVNFYKWNCLFLNPPFFGVWSLVFSSLRRPLSLICFMFLLILSVSWHYCSWFSFINLLFGSLRKIVVLFWTKNSKNIIDSFKKWFFVEQTLVFLDFDKFLLQISFHVCFFAIFSMSF